MSVSIYVPDHVVPMSDVTPLVAVVDGIEPDGVVRYGAAQMVMERIPSAYVRVTDQYYYVCFSSRAQIA